VVLWSVNFDISVYNPTLAHKYLIGLKNTWCCMISINSNGSLLLYKSYCVHCNYWPMNGYWIFVVISLLYMLKKISRWILQNITYADSFVNVSYIALHCISSEYANSNVLGDQCKVERFTLAECNRLRTDCLCWMSLRCWIDIMKEEWFFYLFRVDLLFSFVCG
jgi:hypothetical protein